MNHNIFTDKRETICWQRLTQFNMVKNKIHWSNYSGECCAKSDIIKGVFTYYVTTFWSHRRNFEQSDLQIRLGHWPQHPCSYRNLYLLQEATTVLYDLSICYFELKNAIISKSIFWSKKVPWLLKKSNMKKVSQFLKDWQWVFLFSWVKAYKKLLKSEVKAHWLVD